MLCVLQSQLSETDTLCNPTRLTEAFSFSCDLLQRKEKCSIFFVESFIFNELFKCDDLTPHAIKFVFAHCFRLSLLVTW